jgi:hypothetical protein
MASIDGDEHRHREDAADDGLAMSSMFAIPERAGDCGDDAHAIAENGQNCGVFIERTSPVGWICWRARP